MKANSHIDGPTEYWTMRCPYSISVDRVIESVYAADAKMKSRHSTARTHHGKGDRCSGCVVAVNPPSSQPSTGAKAGSCRETVFEPERQLYRRRRVGLAPGFCGGAQGTARSLRGAATGGGFLWVTFLCSLQRKVTRPRCENRKKQFHNTR